jgi:hypothetical protein
MMVNIKGLINEFIKLLISKRIEIYNEFSLQHELGIYLKDNLPQYKIQFERNISFFRIIGTPFVKKEIDISIFSPDNKEKYAIELKYPTNGQYPEQMFAFIKDIRFMEQMKENGFNSTFCLAIVDDELFYCKGNNEGIYAYFRNNKIITGRVYKPTGEGKTTIYITLSNEYRINWKVFSDKFAYYLIEI